MSAVKFQFPPKHSLRLRPALGTRCDGAALRKMPVPNEGGRFYLRLGLSYRAKMLKPTGG